MMKRIAILLLLAVLLLSGCDHPSTGASSDTAVPPETTSGASTETEAALPVSMYDLSKAMEAADPSLPKLLRVSSSDTDAATLFEYLSTFEYDKVAGYFLAYAADGSASELAVVAVKDPADLPALKASLETHVAERVKLYKNYAPEQVAQAEAAQVVTSDRYAALVMCQAQDAVLAAFRQGIQK